VRLTDDVRRSRQDNVIRASCRGHLLLLRWLLLLRETKLFLELVEDEIRCADAPHGVAVGGQHRFGKGTVEGGDTIPGPCLGQTDGLHVLEVQQQVRDVEILR
jgi:hypothetical protein